MLTDDVFFRRYANCKIWSAYSEQERCLLYQAFYIIKTLFSSHNQEDGDKKWRLIHDRLAIEFGVSKLFDINYQSYDGITDEFYDECISFEEATESFFTEYSVPDQNINPDDFIKKRLSFLELAMRLRQHDIDSMPIEATKKSAAIEFQRIIDELNKRFHRAKVGLVYRNSSIYLIKNQKLDEEVGQLFWDLVADPMWKNVAKQIQQAIKLRDNNPQDLQEQVAISASKSIENVLKIIAEKNGYAKKKESGVGYARYLSSADCKNYKLADWEYKILECYFQQVRNPLAHSSDRTINNYQANWIIHNAMAWINSLIYRIP